MPTFKTTDLRSLIESCVENAIVYEEIQIEFPNIPEISHLDISFDGIKEKGRYKGQIDGFLIFKGKVDGLNGEYDSDHNTTCVNFPPITIDDITNNKIDNEKKEQFVSHILKIFARKKLIGKKEYLFTPLLNIPAGYSMGDEMEEEFGDEIEQLDYLLAYVMNVTQVDDTDESLEHYQEEFSFKEAAKRQVIAREAVVSFTRIWCLNKMVTRILKLWDQKENEKYQQQVAVKGLSNVAFDKINYNELESIPQSYSEYEQMCVNSILRYTLDDKDFHKGIPIEDDSMNDEDLDDPDELIDWYDEHISFMKGKITSHSFGRIEGDDNFNDDLESLILYVYETVYGKDLKKTYWLKRKE